MAIYVPKKLDQLIEVLVYAVNSLQGQLIVDGYHRDLTQTTSGSLLTQDSIVLTQLTVNAASATSISTAITLVNNELGVLSFHMADDQVHLVADTVNNPSLDGYSPVVTTGVLVTDTASVVTLVNALKV